MSSRFSIQQVLSEHGTGQLARALDMSSGSPVVIRIFKCASDDERASLEALMGVLAEIRHPNLEPVREIVREGGDLIVVTELVEGETIAEVVARGPLAVDEFKQVAAQLLGALSAAHQRGAVHGSIHAGRILISRTGQPLRVCITGWGLGFSDGAKGDDFSAFLCVPPEQWEQHPARRRSDVYSLGCVFYQALSGRSPFDGKSLKEVRHKHMHHDVRPLEQVAPQAPAWLCGWVMSLLNPSTDERMASATAALDAYRTAEASHSARTPPVSTALSGAVPTATGFVKVAGSAFFRVPNVATQTVRVAPIDPLVQTARHKARAAQRPQVANVPGTAPAAASPRPSGGAPQRQSHRKQWIITGAVAALLAGTVAFLMRDGGKGRVIKVAAEPSNAAEPVKVAANPQGNDLPTVSGGYPGGRQKPVNYAKLVFHAMCDGGVLSTRMQSGNKHAAAAVNDSVFAWKDVAERGRDSTLFAPSNQGADHPSLVSLKPDATFPLARERRFIRFSGEGSPAAALSSSAKNQAREFPFGSSSAGATRGLTFAIVFFQEVKGRQQTVFNLSSSHGSAALRLGDKGEVRFGGRVAGVPDNQQPSVTIPRDKFNPVEPLLVTGIWSAEPAQMQLRLRAASGYAWQSAPVDAPLPKDALGSLLVGREGLPSATSTNKSTDPKSLRAFAGGIAELLIYAAALNEGEIKSLEAQLASYYFPMPKN